MVKKVLFSVILLSAIQAFGMEMTEQKSAKTVKSLITIFYGARKITGTITSQTTIADLKTMLVDSAGIEKEKQALCVEVPRFFGWFTTSSKPISNETLVVAAMSQYNTNQFILTADSTNSGQNK